MYNKFTFPLKITEHNKPLAEAACKAAEELFDRNPESLSYTKFRLFELCGSREEYEVEYMLHRKMLCAFTAKALCDKDEKWFDKLLDIVWAVCDEYTWSLAAHVINCRTAVEKVERIDLFAAETAVALCEIYHIFEHKLPFDVKDRIEYEVRRRIITPYMRKRNRFGVSNWSAVCACGVGAAFMYLGSREEFDEIRDNLLDNMHDFIESYTDDGCCLEGPLYWSYGFSHFCYLAELLRQYTNGEIDFFKDEKVRKMAFFYQNINLGENFFVSFSDAPHTCNYDASLLCLLSEKYEGIIIPPLKYENKFGDFGNDSRYRFAPFIRNLYWGKIPGKSENKAEEFVYYDKAGWYINRKYDYVFAAKAGHNNEPHNHNDIGSFILFDSGEYIIEDIGWSKYDKDYFLPDKRYDNMCASSLGHSVPVVDSKGQKAGAEYCGRITGASVDEFSLELSAAYGAEGLRSYSRSFTFGEDGIIIKDSVDSSVQTVSRFITRIPPVTDGDTVIIGKYRLLEAHGLKAEISSFDYVPRFEGFTASDETVCTAYIIDFDCTGIADAQYVLRKISE